MGGKQPKQNSSTNNQNNQNKASVQIPEQGVIQQEAQQTKNIVIHNELSLEDEFLKFISEKKRKTRWQEVFKGFGIIDMNGLIQAYRLDRNSVIGQKCNEAEHMILKNYILQRNNETEYPFQEKEFQNDSINDDDQIDIQKNILVLGITGQGKTTFINSFVTYLKGFNKKDSYVYFHERYYVAKTKTAQARSDTQSVNQYQILYIEETSGKKVLFNLIDTPGLADTEGFAVDQLRIEQISECLKILHNKQQKLHAVLIVSQSSTQYEVLDGEKTLLQMSILNILKLFGQSMCGYTTHILTFSDFTTTNYFNFESSESVFHALTMQQMHVEESKNNKKNMYQMSQQISQKQYFQQYLQLQNSVFKVRKIGFIERIQIKKNIDNYGILIEKLRSSEGFQLDETIAVIKQRTVIKQQEQIAQQKLTTLLRVKKSIADSLKKIEIFQNRVNDTKDFKYIEFITECKKEENKFGKFFTNCLNCDQTCCNDCKVPPSQIEHCNQMFFAENKQLKCQKCLCLCSKHVNETHKWTFKQVPIERKDVNLEKENIDSTKQLNYFEELKQQFLNSKNQAEKDIKLVMKTLKECLEQILSSALYNFDIQDQEVATYIEKCYPQFKGLLNDVGISSEYQIAPNIKETAQKKAKTSRTIFQRTTTQF